MKLLSFVLLAVIAVDVQAQDNGFPYGKVGMKDVAMRSYPADTAASGVFLNEFGEAYFDEIDNHLVFQYHAVIKILRVEGLQMGDVTINLYRQDGRKEFLRTARASSYNLENGSFKETALEQRAIHTVNVSEHRDQVKFAVPNVRVGSVIEISYETKSPFLFKFRNWEFQSDNPKIRSEYWATIPANFLYNITLRGFLELSKNENVVIKECLVDGAGGKADCARYKWAIDNVPAFLSEDYMTARSNFISMINFELSEVTYFDGRKDRVTKEWKDAEQELRSSDRFGQQLKRGESIVDAQIDGVIANEKDPLIRAQKVFGFIQRWYTWDGSDGMFSELGIKKAFDARKGNVGDINLSLVAALRYAGIEADPLLLSTRDNGLPTEIHPVLSDFDYVIAKIHLGDKDYLLDATDDFLPFGTVPLRCLNGKGRVFSDKNSYWYELKTPVRARRRSLLSMKLEPTGMIQGNIERIYSGYDAIDERKKIASAGSQDNYFKELQSEHKAIELTKYTIDNAEDLNQPLRVRLEFEWSCFQNLEAENFLFNPFVFDRISENPFRSKERMYPVDFGASQERTVMMTLEYPQAYQPAELPAKVGIALPNATAKYLFDLKSEGNKITMQSYLTIGKPIFTSDEYHFLKELYAQIVANQQTVLLFKKKT